MSLWLNTNTACIRALSKVAECRLAVRNDIDYSARAVAVYCVEVVVESINCGQTYKVSRV